MRTKIGSLGLALHAMSLVHCSGNVETDFAPTGSTGGSSSTGGAGGTTTDGGAGSKPDGSAAGTGGTNLKDAAPESSITCPSGVGDCDGDPSNGCETPLSSIETCGSCGNSCTKPNAQGSCTQGACTLTCLPGFDDCNASPADGCEVNLQVDNANCGACGYPCATGCSAGSCAGCDEALSIDDADPLHAAHALGICNPVSAKWVNPDGSAPAASANYHLGHGILAAFGPNVSPRAGARMLALSSGAARAEGDPGYQSPEGFNKNIQSASPQGYPKESPSCPGVTSGSPYDGVALEVQLAVPSWAKGYSLSFDFYTYEWPQYICSTYNDIFLVLQSPPPAGASDGNVAFDADGNPMSVNSTFLNVCGCTGGPPCQAGGKSFACQLGTAELQGTGFANHAASGWQKVSAPATPGSTITLRFVIYDSGDAILDSTVLLDDFKWIPQ